MQANFLFQLYCLLSVHLMMAACCCCGGCFTTTTQPGGFTATTTGEPVIVEPGETIGTGDILSPESPETPPVPAGEVIAGGELNKFFPAEEPPYDLVAKQEKEGFALYHLSREGTEVAALAISDIRANPEAADKYRNATEMISDFPAAPSGSKGIGVLVAGRFQVTVRSLDDQFTADDRINWLKKFDLDALTKLP